VPIPKGFRERKLSTVRCDKRSFRTKHISKGRRLLICCPVGKFKKGRCRVGTRAKAMLIPKKR
jgi:hypothetical protein